MKVGIVGLPRTGKTTVFSALTGQTPEPFRASSATSAAILEFRSGSSVNSLSIWT